MARLTRHRIFEIGVALLLTLAAIIFVGLTVWAAEAGRITIADAWARAPLGEDGMSAAYMTIANLGDTDDVLKSARTPGARSVEFRQTTMSRDGVIQTRKVEGGLPIEAGASLVLEPGKTHLMLVGLEEAMKAGEDLVLTLEFAHAGRVHVVLPVRDSAPVRGTASIELVSDR